MADIITADEVATWAQRDVATFGAFEAMVIEQSRGLVADEAQHIDWLTEDVEVPFRARMIALNLARRTILNPDQVVQEGSIGPIGGDRVRDAAALGMELSDAEKTELHNLRGDPTDDGVPGLWVLPTSSGDRSFPTIYVPDDSASDWLIPYATVGDVGEADANGEF